MDRLDPVIHQQARLLILAALYRNRRASFTDLRDGLDLTSGNLASHAARLVEAGYVRSERVLTAHGFEAQYVITPQGSDAFLAYAQALREVLGEEAAQAAGLGHKQSQETGSSDA